MGPKRRRWDPDAGGGGAVVDVNVSGGINATNVQQSMDIEQITLDAQMESVYQLIIGQLLSDGFSHAANMLVSTLGGGGNYSVAASPRLSHLVALGEASEGKVGIENNAHTSGLFAPSSSHSDGLELTDIVETEMAAEAAKRSNSVLDFDKVHASIPLVARAAPDYITRCAINYQKPCLAVEFDRRGALVACGTQDCGVSIMDVRRLSEPRDDIEGDRRPLVRSLMGHTGPVNTISFHPTQPVLASGSADRTICLFRFEKAIARRPAQILRESIVVSSLCFHPLGDHLLASGHHPVIRLYDANTMQCFAPINPEDNHHDAVLQVNYSSEGRSYVSSSRDGTIKVWDGVSSRCTMTIPNAHEGREVVSTRFTRNGKYLLSTGQESSAKLWEVTSGRVVATYGIANPSKWRSTNATLSHNEQFVFAGDASRNAVGVWDARTGAQVSVLTGHAGPVNWIASHSNVEGIVSAGDDGRVRYWHLL